MPTWLIVVITLVVIGLLVFVILELPPQHRFIDSAGNKDLAKLKAWLDKGCDPNKPGFLGMTALGAAVQEGHAENVSLLLQRGADPNISSMKSLPLQTAVEQDRPDLIRCLLDHGADPYSPGLFKTYALQDAVVNAKIEVVKAFVERGVDFNRKSSHNVPLIHTLLITIISTRGDTERETLRKTLQLLLENGTNPNVRSQDDFPAIAVAMDDPPSLRHMVDAGAITDINFQGADLHTAIMEILAGKKS